MLALVLTNINYSKSNKKYETKNMMMAEVFVIGLQSRKPLLIALAVQYFVIFESSMSCTENTVYI